MATAKSPDDQFSDEEIARRRDDVIRRMANTPPKPHAAIKGGKAPVKKKPSPKNARKKPNG
jgi:hypothetical protein